MGILELGLDLSVKQLNLALNRWKCGQMFKAKLAPPGFANGHQGTSLLYKHVKIFFPKSNLFKIFWFFLKRSLDLVDNRSTSILLLLFYISCKKFDPCLLFPFPINTSNQNNFILPIHFFLDLDYSCFRIKLNKEDSFVISKKCQ